MAIYRLSRKHLLVPMKFVFFFLQRNPHNSFVPSFQVMNANNTFYLFRLLKVCLNKQVNILMVQYPKWKYYRSTQPAACSHRNKTLNKNN